MPPEIQARRLFRSNQLGFFAGDSGARPQPHLLSSRTVGNSGRKERSEWVYAKTAGCVDSIEVTIAEDGSGIIFGTPVVDTHIRTEYDRKKGPKVVNQTPLENGILPFTPDDALTTNFDIAAAVDTNTKILFNRPISVTGIVIGSWDFKDDGTWRSFKGDLALCLEFSPVTAFREQLGWALALQELSGVGEFAAAKRKALVVDSDLGALGPYNDRERPFFENLYVPSGVTLVYASADTGTEYLANAMLRYADRCAKVVLDRIQSSQLAPSPVSSSFLGAPFSSFRRIRPARLDSAGRS